jgi:hypothetical protein
MPIPQQDIALLPALQIIYKMKTIANVKLHARVRETQIKYLDFVLLIVQVNRI